MRPKCEVMNKIEGKTPMQTPRNKKRQYLPEMIMQVVSDRRSLIAGPHPAGKVAVDKVQISGTACILVCFYGVPLAFGRQHPHIVKPRDLL